MITHFLVALHVFFIIGMLWLAAVAKNAYREQQDFLMRPEINRGSVLTAAISVINGGYQSG